MARDKRTVWIPLDQELAAALTTQDGALSSIVNEVVRDEVARRMPTAQKK